MSRCETPVTGSPPPVLCVRALLGHRRVIVATSEPDLLALAERVDALAAERTSGRVVGDDAARRAARLRDHLAGHVLPRARSLDAPLLVLLIGPTGAGKSSLVNALAGRPVSRSGVLRPTTRELVAVVHPADRDALLAETAPLVTLAGERLRVVTDEAAPRGIALVDAPDVDSIEHANRELTDRLAEAADLGIFVTTATRYADRVPWDVLLRARDRGLPLVVVINRMPEEPADRVAVLDDLDRLLAEFGIDARGLERATPADEDGDAGALAVLPVPEGAVDPQTDGLAGNAVAPLRARIDALGRDRDARRALAARALAGSLAGLAPLIERVADDADHEAIDADALTRTARSAFESELGSLRDDLSRGTFLRAEALRQWQSFVGADEVTRLFSTGIGKVRGTLSALIRGTPKAPVAEVREEALADIVALARSHAAEAARRTAADWADEPATRDAITDDPTLWGPSPRFDERLTGRLEGWVESIAADVQATGGGKRRLAKGASIGVNAAGVGVMLATFAHTGGVTGAEVGVAAATAFLNQKLLEALFGEAALVEMIDGARSRLADALAASFEEELGRYRGLVPDGAALRDLASRLRDGARDVAALQPAIPLDARAVAVDGGSTTDDGAPRLEPADAR
ncbi:MAG TPA: GTPase domain-containing protein [Candidatus Limnocylindrales bacterium]|nr:GTPase domain-containing protein [Candidatus Limnocylindrales bacterium]